MNALEKSSAKHENPNANNSLLNFDFFTTKSEEEPAEPAPEPPVAVDKLPEAPKTAYQMWVHSNNDFKFPNIPGLRLAEGPYSEKNWKALDPSERNVSLQFITTVVVVLVWGCGEGSWFCFWMVVQRGNVASVMGTFGSGLERYLL